MDRPWLLNVGNNNFLNASKVLAVSAPDAISVKRTLKAAIKDGLVLDFTGALKTRCLIICENGVVIRSPLRTIDLERRLNTFDNSIKLAP